MSIEKIKFLKPIVNNEGHPYVTTPEADELYYNIMAALGQLHPEICVIPRGSVSTGRECGNANTVAAAIPRGVTTIDSEAFIGCDKLEHVYIPYGVEVIDDEAFRNCDLLTTVNIPASVTSIDSYAFAECDSLTSIVYLGTVEQWNNIEKGSNWISDHLNFTVYCYNGEIIADGYTKGLSFAKISDSYHVMSYTGDSNTVVIPSVYKGMAVTAISNDAFVNNTSIRNIIIPEGIQVINVDAFCGCSSLTSITIPSSVTTIYYGVFSGCTSLKNIYFGGTITQWEACTTSMHNDFWATSELTISCSDGNILINTVSYGGDGVLSNSIVAIPENASQVFINGTCSGNDGMWTGESDDGYWVGGEVYLVLCKHSSGDSFDILKSLQIGIGDYNNDTSTFEKLDIPEDARYVGVSIQSNGTYSLDRQHYSSWALKLQFTSINPN